MQKSSAHSDIKIITIKLYINQSNKIKIARKHPEECNLSPGFAWLCLVSSVFTSHFEIF